MISNEKSGQRSNEKQARKLWMVPENLASGVGATWQNVESVCTILTACMEKIKNKLKSGMHFLFLILTWLV